MKLVTSIMVALGILLFTTDAFANIEIDLRTWEGVSVIISILQWPAVVPFTDDEAEWQVIAVDKCRARQAQWDKQYPDSTVNFTLWGKNSGDPQYFLCVPDVMPDAEFAEKVCKSTNTDFIGFKDNDHILVCGKEVKA